MPKIKTPPPEVGDRVKLKGRDPTGVLRSVNDLRWCRVEWQGEKGGPKLVHLDELEKIAPCPPSPSLSTSPQPPNG